MMKRKPKRKKAASNKKQPITEKEFQFLRECAENSVIVAFAGHRLSKQQ